MELNGTAADDNRTGLSVTTITPPAGLHLNEEQKANLILWVATYRQSGNRLVQEFVRMCEALYNIQTMLETQFIPFVEQHLGLTKGTAYRYLTIYRGMKLVNAGNPALPVSPAKTSLNLGITNNIMSVITPIDTSITATG